MPSIMRCNCGYTLKRVCEKCGPAKSVHPPRFSSADKYGKYRRIAKEQSGQKKNS